MDLDELRRYLDVSLWHSVVVDVRELPEAPGFLRTVTVRQGYRVTIVYEKCSEYIDGTGEGWIKYIGKYNALEVLVEDLAQYIGKPIAEWQNYTRDPYEPKVLDEPDHAANMNYFEDMVRSRRMALPPRGDFKHAYVEWRHIERYGEFRQDKLAEEQDLWLREHNTDPDNPENGEPSGENGVFE